MHFSKYFLKGLKIYHFTKLICRFLVIYYLDIITDYILESLLLLAVAFCYQNSWFQGDHVTRHLLHKRIILSKMQQVDF